MTFLLDENLALSYAEALHDIGIDAIHVIDVGLHQTKDEDIVDFARKNKQAIITFDLDHTRIVAMSGNQLASIITFRVMQFSKEILVNFFQEHYTTLLPALERGTLITVSDTSIRIKELPIQKD